MLELLLELAQTGLKRAARQLKKRNDAQAKELARVLLAAHDGISSYLAQLDAAI